MEGYIKCNLSEGEISLINLALKYFANQHTEVLVNYLNAKLGCKMDAQDCINDVIELRGKLKSAIINQEFQNGYGNQG